MEYVDTEQGYIYEEPRSSKEKIVLFYKTVCHGVFFTHHALCNIYGCLFFMKIYDHELDIVRQIYTYAPCFGTNWNFLFQTVFLSLSVSHDALEWLDRHETSLGKKLRYYRDVLFCGLVVPFTMFISTMFWTLFWIDRELVFPKIYDNIVPWWFNHCVHTNISVVILVETIIQARRHPTNRNLELMINGAVGILYAIVYYSIYFFANRWLYGVFGIMTWWQVCLYQILIWTSTFVFYFIQFPINRIFHKAEDVPAVEEQKNGVVETVKSNGVEKANGAEKANGEPKTDLKQPLSTKSWSLKYRTIRSQFENSSL